MKIRLTLLLAALLLTVAACAPSQELRNASFLNDSSLTQSDADCSAPCWRGITPGVTEWSTAISLLEDQTDLADIKVENNSESGEVAVTFQRKDGVPCCLLYSKDGALVDQMLLQLAPQNTLGAVTEAMGEPVYFNGTEVDEKQAAAALFYPDRGLVIYAFVEGKTGSLSATSEVFAALYLSENDMQQVMATSTLQAYNGYKAFSDYLDDEPALTPVPAEDATAVEGEADTEGDATPETEATTENTTTETEATPTP